MPAREYCSHASRSVRSRGARLHLGGVARVDEHARAGRADDVAGAAVAGRHDRQPGGRRLDERDPEVLDQGGVDEHAAAGGGQPVEDGDVDVGLVPLRQRHLAVQVVAVEQQQEFREHLALVVLHGSNVLADAGEDRQVGQLLELGILAVGRDEALDVLALVGARDRQDQGLLGVGEEAGDLALHAFAGAADVVARVEALLVVAQVRVEALDGDARRKHLEGGGGRGVVELVALLDLVAGRGDDDVRVGEHALLDVDAVKQVVARLHRVGIDPGAAQHVALVAAQAVSGEHQRHPEARGELVRDVAGVGVVPVDEVGEATLVAEQPHRGGHQLVEVGPQRLLAAVALAAAAQAHDAGGAFLVEWLDLRS
jgi:hypothetical protein